jgi:hypothetical protein
MKGAQKTSPARRESDLQIRWMQFRNRVCNRFQLHRQLRCAVY